jgi:hypothetical protein
MRLELTAEKRSRTAAGRSTAFVIENMDRFSPETERLLRASGWFEGRTVPALVEAWRAELETPGGFALSPAARQVLSEFGGLHIQAKGAGIACARSDIDLNPLLAKCEEDRFSSFNCLQGKQLFPLGEADLGHLFVAIDGGGNVYLVMQFVVYVADSFDAALEVLLLGKKTKLLEEHVV